MSIPSAKQDAQPDRFAGKRVLVTSADAYMGPPIARRFRESGADVVTDTSRYLDDPDEPARIIAQVGHIDILVVNLMPSIDLMTPLLDMEEDAWQHMFDAIARPTQRFIKAVLPQMIDRKAGKVITVASAAPLRAIPGTAAYSAARGAQNTYVRVAGTEVARHNVQINSTAQNFTYGGFPDNAMEIDTFREMVMREVPAQRFAEGWELAELVLYLASDYSNFINGQVIPFAGGWPSTS